MEHFFNPTNIHFGQGTINKLPGIIEKINGPILLVTGSNSLRVNPPFASIWPQIDSSITTQLNNVPSNPDIADIFKYVNSLKNEKFKCILAIGGGSVIDSAKAVGALLNSKTKTVEELRVQIKNKAFKSVIPLIAVPTTSGTGSEVNPWGTIWDREKNARLALGSDLLFPVDAIIDPDLALTMPTSLTASTGLDVLCHAFEGLWAKKANSISRIYALKAISLVFEHLEGAIKNPTKKEHRVGMALASTLSGVCISVSRTTVCHAISYPLTLDYNIQHGIACALTINEAYQFNKGCIPEENNLDAVFAKGLGKQSFSIFLKNICACAGIPTRLADYGVKREDLPELAHKSIYPESLENNPKPISEETILEFLKQIF